MFLTMAAAATVVAVCVTTAQGPPDEAKFKDETTTMALAVIKVLQKEKTLTVVPCNQAQVQVLVEPPTEARGEYQQDQVVKKGSRWVNETVTKSGEFTTVKGDLTVVGTDYTTTLEGRDAKGGLVSKYAHAELAKAITKWVKENAATLPPRTQP